MRENGGFQESPCRSLPMNPSSVFDQISEKLSEIAAQSPARDIEKNVRAMATSAFARLDLVTREEFDVQAQMLLRAREQLNALERRVAELEAALAVRDQAD
jgi:BMFP domain-containing protein YqiC